MQKVHFNRQRFSAMFNLKTVGKNWGDKSWHVYKPSKVRMLDVSNKEDSALYVAAQELQKTVAKGSAKPNMKAMVLRRTLSNSLWEQLQRGAAKRDWSRPLHYERFYKILYSGLKRNYGFCNIDQGYRSESGKIKFDPKDYGWAKKEITDKDYEDHLTGKKSIGINPCDDEGTSIFGAIDIDPKSYTNFNLKKYLEIITEKNLPVIPVKSKSGGLHLYVFTTEKIKASEIREFLEKLLFVFGLPSTQKYIQNKLNLKSVKIKDHQVTL